MCLSLWKADEQRQLEEALKQSQADIGLLGRQHPTMSDIIAQPGYLYSAYLAPVQQPMDTCILLGSCASGGAGKAYGMMMEEEDPELAAALALSMQVRARDKPSLWP